MVCPSCSAGDRCSGGSTTDCSGTTGARNYFGNTFGSCTTNDAGYFASSHELEQSACPAYKYATTGSESCSFVSAGYAINSAKSGQDSCDGSTTQSGYGAGYCSNAPVGYYIGSGQSAGPISMRGIPTGYYKSSQGS